jgi:hypothetical protein
MKRLSIVAAVLAIGTFLITTTNAQSYNTPDDIAEALGYLIAKGSLCSRPTAQFEAELETYLKRLQPGPLEADRLRKRMMASRQKYGGFLQSLQTKHCENVDAETAQKLADIRAHGG